MKLTSAALVILATLAPACAFNINKPVVESSYLDQFSAGGGGSMKPSSYGPSKGKPSGSKGGVPGSYLERMGGGGAPVASAPAAPAAPAPAAPAPAASSMSASSSSAPADATSKDYLSHLNTGAASSGGIGSGMKGYLDALPTRSEAAGPGFTSYLGAIGGGGSAMKSSTYAPTKSSKATSNSPSYSAPAPAAASSSTSGGETMIAQEPVLGAINKLSDNMNRNQEATIGVLHEINNSVKTLADKTI